MFAYTGGVAPHDWRSFLSPQSHCVISVLSVLGFDCTGEWFPTLQRMRDYPRCPNCRQTQEQDAIQKRVEAGRLRAKKAIYAFVATRFARHVVPGTAWYRDVPLKAKMANALNTHFRRDPLFRTLYPHGITGKWVEAGRSRMKNWLCIELAR
jgi:hypothetical protein